MRHAHKHNLGLNILEYTLSLPQLYFHIDMKKIKKISVKCLQQKELRQKKKVLQKKKTGTKLKNSLMIFSFLDLKQDK